jgi:hypothetical protein
LYQQAYDSEGQVTTPVSWAAQLSGSRITAGQTGSIADGALEINGIALGELTPAGSSLQADEIANWINAASASGVTATASNEVRVPVSSLKLDRSLYINGESIGVGFASAADLVQAINDQTTDTGVQASFSRDGDVVLTNVSGEEGLDITITPSDSTGNVLNITGGVYTGQVTIVRALVSGEETPIEIGFADGGTPEDLARLGFRTSATLMGSVPEDVLVFVTGSGTASVAASYTGSPADNAAVARAAHEAGFYSR